jgi:thioredoxin-like negative regulator of GroEL
MSWLALPFADRDAKQRVSEKFGVNGIPMLVVLDGATGGIKAANGRSAMHNGKAEEVVKLWCDAPAVAQSTSAKPDGATHLTQNGTATNASPATKSSWAVDLLGASLCSKLGRVETRDALANKKIVCLYFSAHWCPPCRGFTPVLEEKYKELKGIAPDDMEVVFVSSDRDSSSFNEYYATMSWLALPFADRDAKQRVSEKFGVNGIPMLVVLDGATGAIKAANGRSAMHSGSVQEVVKLWCETE